MSKFIDAANLVAIDDRLVQERMGERLERVGITEDAWMAFGTTRISAFLAMNGVPAEPHVADAMTDLAMHCLLVGYEYGRLTADAEVPR